MAVSHNPTTPPRPANRGKTGYGKRGVDLNAPKQPPAIRGTRKKRA
jgi:hypothetical protein